MTPSLRQTAEFTSGACTVQVVLHHHGAVLVSAEIRHGGEVLFTIPALRTARFLEMICSTATPGLRLACQRALAWTAARFEEAGHAA